MNAPNWSNRTDDNLIHFFVSAVQKVHATGNATEHSYRSAFETLFSGLGVMALNEPKRVKCGAPDFLISKDGIVIGHVEAKDLHISIQGMKNGNKSQQNRYRAALPNLIYTNGLDWDFYRDGGIIASVTIANFLKGVTPKPDQYDSLENLLRDFIAQRPQTITMPRELAERMAGKANLIKDVLRRTLADSEAPETELTAQYQAFKENLIHDITLEDFADIYAETIAYGMFAARLHDTTLDTFSRQEALELLPKSNPFLRSLFTYVAGHGLDDRVAWIIDDLADVFQACDVAKLMESFGKLTGQNDPFLHFYETFLAAYNPSKRKARGVWYTPEPVVNFIVRAVDEVLQNEFSLTDGLADTSKVIVDWDTGQMDKKGKAVTIKKEVHRVQILDPATGTGTFLAEIIKQIAPRIQSVAPNMWSSYIEQDLIPRLHGFELLMASYAMCHMKLDMILTELGYKPTGNPPRFSVYLTNSLEEGEPVNQTLPFAQWISREAKGASTIKRDMPIMCVIGNPPYLGEGGVSEGWIGDLMDDYKKEPGGKVKLKERNSKWLNDLYVKFIRLSSHLIEKNDEGVLGFITNHGYLDNPTFRGMRWHMLKTFDRIWVLDLHGNAKKKEVAPEGPPDKNVFDIQQGVSIIIAAKRQGHGNGLAEVLRQDEFGSRNEKYQQLNSRTLSSYAFGRVVNSAPRYLFREWPIEIEPIWQKGFSLAEFMPVKSNGIVTGSDKKFISSDATKLRETWEINFPNELQDTDIIPISYRLFEKSFLAAHVKKVERLRLDVMRHYFNATDGNLGLLVSKQLRDFSFAHVWVTPHASEAIFLSPTTATNAMNFPLYLYPVDTQDVDQTRQVNFDCKLYKRLQDMAIQPGSRRPNEVAVFDYIYGMLHCPAYRETYAEFLKIDFPRIPWPPSPKVFWDVSAKGTELRKLHLMEPQAIGSMPFPFMGEGDNIVDAPSFKDGKVWINKTQYFDAAPEVSWSLYIGGYQPAKKWLKDRKGRALNFDDVKHYQRILKILSETDRIMGTISMKLA